MSDLPDFQQTFDSALRDRLHPAYRDRALARALTIHRNTSAKAAREALADNYPVVRALTGDDAFGICAGLFAEISPPRDPRLCLYGDGFDRFLSSYAPFSPWSYLADVARLERLVVESLFAADAPALDGAALAASLDLSAPLALHPAARFAQFASPAAEIWLAHQDGAPGDALETLAWRPAAALVTRPAASVMVRCLEPSAITFLQACAAGASLGEAAAAAAGADIQSLFSTFIVAGAFA